MGPGPVLTKRCSNGNESAQLYSDGFLNASEAFGRIDLRHLRLILGILVRQNKDSLAEERMTLGSCHSSVVLLEKDLPLSKAILA